MQMHLVDVVAPVIVAILFIGATSRLSPRIGEIMDVIPSSLLDTLLRFRPPEMAEVVGVVSIIVGQTEGFA
jgi:hypothetical protein